MHRTSVVLCSLSLVCLSVCSGSAAQLVVKINFQLDTAVVPEGI